MLLSSQALWPIEISAVTRIRTMVHKLKISVFKESTTSTDVRTFFLLCSDIFKEKWGNRSARGEVFILTQSIMARWTQKVADPCCIANS